MDGGVVQPRNDGSAFYTYARIATVELDGRRYGVCVREDTTRRRLEALDELLPTLTGVLDIREVFERVSGIARSVIPHDALSLPMVAPDKNHIVVHAVTGFASQIPETIPLPDHHRPLLTSPWDHLVYHDIQEDPLERLTPPGQAGYRARLLVPVRLQGETVGALDFLSLQPASIRPATAWSRDVSPITSRSRCRTSGSRRRRACEWKPPHARIRRRNWPGPSSAE